MAKRDQTSGALPEAELEALFASARAQDPVPSDGLMARVLADAAAVQADMGAGVVGMNPARPSRSLWDRVLDGIGGWTGVSTLAASACVGLVVGLTGPDAMLSYVPGVTVDVTGGEFYELLGADDDGLEGTL